jgi:hypothetical protein
MLVYTSLTKGNLQIITSIIITIICFGGLCSNSLAQSSGITKSTSGGTLDVKLEPTPNPIKSGQETNYKVTFLQKGTSKAQVHIDYDFVILKDNTSEVFKASQKTGQPLLHTAEGIVSIPFTIKDPGNYTIRVSMMGINFIPMATEYADFPIKVE